MDLSRRRFLFGGASLLAAPAIVRASSLMPVRAPKLVLQPYQVDFLMATAEVETSSAYFLDRIAHLYGVHRMPATEWRLHPETDSELRSRLVDTISPRRFREIYECTWPPECSLRRG